MQFFEDKLFLEQNYEWNNEYGITAKSIVKSWYEWGKKIEKILVESPVVGKTEELFPISSRPEKMIQFMTIMTHFKTCSKPADSMAVSLSA